MNFDLVATIDLTNKLGSQYTPLSGYCPVYPQCTAIQSVTAIIMGRVTWESLIGLSGESGLSGQSHPLSRHINIIVTNKTSGITITGAKTNSPTVLVGSLKSALDWCLQAKLRNEFGLSQCIVIGGNKLFQSALSNPLLRYGYLTIIGNGLDNFSLDNATDNGFPIALMQNAKYTIACKHQSSAADYKFITTTNIGDDNSGINNPYMQYRLYDFTK